MPAATARRLLAAAVLSLGQLAVAAPAMAQAPASDYTRLPRLSHFVVSPSNQHAALLLLDDQQRQVLGVLDLARPSEISVVAMFKDADIKRVDWVNDRRLVYEAYEPGAVIERAITMAVDIDGQRRHELISWQRGTRTRHDTLPYGWFVWRSFDERSDDVLVYRRSSESPGEFAQPREVARLNTVTGELRSLSRGQPDFAYHWLFDGDGELRVVASRRDGRDRLHWRPPGQSRWIVIEDQSSLSGEALEALYLEGDGQLIVAARRGRDTYALYAYDLGRRQLADQPLLAVDRYDIGHAVIVDDQARRVVGVQGLASQRFTVWFDEGLTAVQRAVDQALPPGRSNQLLCGRCLSAQRFIVRSSGPRQPGEYFIFDRKTSALTRIGASRPWLPEEQQGERSFHRIAARDGLMLPVVVTHPPGSRPDQPLPAVVLVHGGPWVRGTWLEWSAEPQFLASRGYRVLEVDFRGSTGLGWQHFRAGWRQYGLAMQDDLADAVAWAVAQKAVDAQRVCIVGASYGGYAALMGPVRHPGLYRCAASYAGITDLALLFAWRDGDVPRQAQRHGLPELVGDPVADAEMLRQQSPLHRVAEIKVPVLLAQGGLDRRVTKAHADRFAAAAKRAGVDLERVTYAEEGHGWFMPANHADFLRRLEALLQRSLRTRAP